VREVVIAVFCNEVKGKSALALSCDLGLSYKSAFVLLHKLREAMAEEMKGRVVGGEGKVAEVDGGYFGGYVGEIRLCDGSFVLIYKLISDGSHKHIAPGSTLNGAQRKATIVELRRHLSAVDSNFAVACFALRN
jgi:hypothetical protein